MDGVNLSVSKLLASILKCETVRRGGRSLLFIIESSRLQESKELIGADGLAHLHSSFTGRRNDHSESGGTALLWRLSESGRAGHDSRYESLIMIAMFFLSFNH